MPAYRSLGTSVGRWRYRITSPLWFEVTPAGKQCGFARHQPPLIVSSTPGVGTALGSGLATRCTLATTALLIGSFFVFLRILLPSAQSRRNLLLGELRELLIEALAFLQGALHCLC